MAALKFWTFFSLLASIAESRPFRKSCPSFRIPESDVLGKSLVGSISRLIPILIGSGAGGFFGLAPHPIGALAHGSKDIPGLDGYSVRVGICEAGLLE